MSATLPATVGALPVRRRRDDYAFLPAALEITETPLSPIRTSMTLTICALVAGALALGYLGHIDVIAAAQGKIQPVGRTKTVEPLEPGRVSRILVENGQAVRAGDLLIALDPSDSRAEEAELAATLAGLEAEVLRRRAALAATEGDGETPPAIDWGGTPERIRAREQRVLDGDLAQLAGQVASLKAHRAQALAEAERLRGTIAAQGALASTSKQRFDMRNELLGRNAESKASVIDAQEAYQGQLATLAAQTGQLGETEAARAVADRDIEQARRTFRADNATRLADAERRIDEARQRLEKARVRVAGTELRSPVDGQVSGLTVTSPGQVVSSGEQVLQIVPGGGPLEIEAYLSNADAGFVKPGQTAVVKVQAYPFTDYGTVEARVMRVGKDAIPLQEAEMQEGNPVLTSKGKSFGGAQRMQNLVFPVTLALDKPVIDAAGATQPLMPGMSVTIEVRTGTRRMLSYVLAPLVEIAGSAFRER